MRSEVQPPFASASRMRVSRASRRAGSFYGAPRGRPPHRSSGSRHAALPVQSPGQDLPVLGGDGKVNLEDQGIARQGDQNCLDDRGSPLPGPGGDPLKGPVRRHAGHTGRTAGRVERLPDCGGVPPEYDAKMACAATPVS